jgi:hypothetical protein
MRLRRRAPFVLAALALAAPAARAADLPVRVLESQGRWESSYGERFYNVVGTLRNEGPRPLRWVKLRVEAVDEAGRVVATTETYNERAGGLAVPDLDDAAREALRGRLRPLPPGAEEAFRAGFLRDETPAFVTHRVTVVEAPAAAR